LETQKEYEAFLQEVLDAQEVYILQNDEGLACQNGTEHCDVMCILAWGSPLMAEDQREGEFEDLSVEAIPLFEFLFNWLPNMQEEGVYISINWCQEEGGLEVEPNDLRDHLKLILPEDLQNSYRKIIASRTC